MPGVQPFVRTYRPTDLDAVYDICVRTADGGTGALGVYSSDRLIGDIFAAPYVTHEPEHAHVVDDGEGNAVGYILGTANTAEFVRWYRDEWLPATGYPPSAQDDEMLALHRGPERMIVPELAAYPAHLHIDVLPDWQGKGLGRELMVAFLGGLAEADVRAVHLGMLSANVGARAFYDRVGFHEVEVPDAGPLTFMGRATDYSARPRR
jgi:ribosomal protein S18 acetylase RimI-like enzyme